MQKFKESPADINPTPHRCSDQPVGVTSSATRNAASRILYSWKQWSHGLNLNTTVVDEYFNSGPPLMLNLGNHRLTRLPYVPFKMFYVIVGRKN